MADAIWTREAWQFLENRRNHFAALDADRDRFRP